MFVTIWVIFSIKEVRNKERLYTIFTKAFWKIQGFFTENSLRFFDIGSLVEINIDRKNGTNRFRNITHRITAPKEWQDSRGIIYFLEILAFLSKEIPENAKESNIFDELVDLLKETTKQEKMLALHSVLFWLRLSHILWLHIPETAISLAGKKIITLSKDHTLQELFRIRWITPDITESLYYSLKHTFHHSYLW